MPTPKGKSPKAAKSPKGKNSPKKSPKGGEGKKVEAELKDEFEYKRPPTPPPPPQPPRGCLLSRIRRHAWYPYANRALYTHREWFWSPFAPVMTSWGEVWVTDPQMRRILRYSFDSIGLQIKRLGEITTRGEPRAMVEVPLTGRMAVLNTCPKAMKTSLTLYDPVGGGEEARVDYRYQRARPRLEADTLPTDTAEAAFHEPPDDSAPIGLCANRYAVFVLFQPLQRIQALHPVSLKRLDFVVTNWFSDPACAHFTSSGGCAANETHLCICATRPARVQVFRLKPRLLLGQIEQLSAVWCYDLGLDRLSLGEPYGLQVDALGLVVVSDSSTARVSVYSLNKRPAGQGQASLPSGEAYCLGGWKVDLTQPVRPGHFSLGLNGTMCLVDRWSNQLLFYADRTQLRWLDDTFILLSQMPIIRPLLDAMMPKAGLPAPPYPKQGHLTLDERAEDPIDEAELMPPELALRFRLKGATPPPEEDGDAQKKGKKSPDKKSPGKKSPKSKSPGKSSPKKK